MMRDDWVYRRGDIYIADLGKPFGSEQGGVRPVLVISNNVGNYYSPTILVSPLTSRDKKSGFPAHYILRKESVPCLQKTSTVLCEQSKPLDKRRVIRYVGRVDKGHLNGIDRAMNRELHYGERSHRDICQVCRSHQ